ncbi:hypothetical protein GGI07_002482 [Coemansia sp. Benny D115]|nr:hypothetical protein GGI07_002482 [Coemansia sp. Benny D115]
MSLAAFGNPPESHLLKANPFVQHFYPVLGTLNSPVHETSALTPYAKQVARSILKYFRNSATTEPVSEESSIWDVQGPFRHPRWQTVAFGRVDDIPRRKSLMKREGHVDLSPRSAGSEMYGEGLLSSKWVAKHQARPATVLSFHTLAAASTTATTAATTESMAGEDSALAEEIARNRVCLASYDITYTAVVVINRALADDPATEQRLAAVSAKAGLDQHQFSVCRPGTAQQFQVFLSDLERRLFAKAARFYAAAFMRTQAKLAAIPQLPIAASPTSPGSVYHGLAHNDSDDQLGRPSDASSTTAILSDPVLVSQYSRYLPLRAWLVRYHYKLCALAECLGDRDTAQRCLWMAYLHLFSYIAEIASGAYLPPEDDSGSRVVADGSGAPLGWMWAMNGGDHDAARSHSLRMFGRRWDEALILLEAINLRLVRGWVYQSIDQALMKSSSKLSPSGGAGSGWSYGFGGSNSQQSLGAQISMVNRSGIRAVGRPAVSVMSPGGSSGVGGSVQTGGGAAIAAAVAAVAGGNGSLDPLVLSVHAGEYAVATEQLMNIERRRRSWVMRRADARDTGHPVYFLALGSETADIDLIQPSTDLAESGNWWWWPLGGHYGILDFSRPGEPPKPGLVANNSMELSGACSMLPATNQYDTFLTLAARQSTQHVLVLALILKQSGFGDRSSYFWATIERHYSMSAAFHMLVTENGYGFGTALGAAVSRMVSAGADGAGGLGAAAQHGSGRQSLDALVATLRQPLATSIAPALFDRLEISPPRPTMDWKGGRPRATSSAFAGFAFDQALGGIYTVVEARNLGRQQRNGGTHDRSTLQLDEGDRNKVISMGPSECIFPLWIWSETAAPLFHLAAQASLQRFKVFAGESQIYMSSTPTNTEENTHRFSANPGVENTYAAIWLVSERKLHTECKDIGAHTSKLLAAALACLASSASSEESAQITEAATGAVSSAPAGPNTAALAKLVQSKSSVARDCLYLVSELAEAYAETGHASAALSLFTMLAQRFRHEGWAALTSHALRWIVKCASTIDDPPSVLEAMVELLSPCLVASEAEREQISQDLVQRLCPKADTTQDTQDECTTDILDMTRIYSPLTCHAHWRSWNMDPGAKGKMAFQVTLDCRALTARLPVSELLIEFSDPRFNIKLTCAEDSALDLKDVVMADGSSAKFIDIGGDLRELACKLQLPLGSTFVVQGTVSFEDAEDQHLLAAGLLAIQSVTVVVGDGHQSGWKLHLVWPTCSPTTLYNALDKAPTNVVQDETTEPLSSMERLLLGNIGVARVQDAALGAAGQLALSSNKAVLTRVGAVEQPLALKRAIYVNGPTASLSHNQQWLSLNSTSDGIQGCWVQLPTPPLTPRISSFKQGKLSTISGDLVALEPAFSVYSRCRVLYFSEPAPMLAVSVPSIAILAPAYHGERFPVDIQIDNLHQNKTLVRVSIDLTINQVGTAAGSGAHGALGALDDVGNSGANVQSARVSKVNSLVSLNAAAAASGAALDEASGIWSGSQSQSKDVNSASRLTPWLSRDDANQSDNQKDVQAISGSVTLDLANIGPQESQTVTVFVNFPTAALSGAWKSSALAVAGNSMAMLKCTARYVHNTSPTLNSDDDVDQQWWSGQVSTQVPVPVLRPLYAEAEPLPSHIAAPVAANLPAATSLPATQLGGHAAGQQYCFHRPILVSLHNSGPWDISIQNLALRPPLLAEEEGLSVQLAGSTAALCKKHDAGDGDASLAIIKAGGVLQHVFWLDISTDDVIHIPSEICPGTLEIQWHRDTKEGTRDFASVLTRLWMRPMELVHRQLQVESECSPAVARVGEPLSLCYRILNPTRSTKVIETSMHASESFVFAGPRRTTLNILPSHVGLLRFNLVPLAAAVMQPPTGQQHGNARHSSLDQAALVYSPSLVLLGLKQQLAAVSAPNKVFPPSNAAGQGWIKLPRLEVRLVNNERKPTAAAAAPSLPPAHSTSHGSVRPSRQGTPAAPPPTRVISTTSTAIGASADGNNDAILTQAQITLRTQSVIARLAGLDVSESGEINMTGMMTPGLLDECMEAVPEYFVRKVITKGSSESDIEDEDDDQSLVSARIESVTAGEDEMDYGHTVLRVTNTDSAHANVKEGEWFVWKYGARPANEDADSEQQKDNAVEEDSPAAEHKNQGNNIFGLPALTSTEDFDNALPPIALTRLEGWPTEFPDDLDAYRNSVWSNTSWASDMDKHRAEIAPWVWHHRGEADILEARAKSTDPREALEAVLEMGRLGILPMPANQRRANAAFVVLLRNRELRDFRDTMRQLEDRFNRRYHYPYVFLNDAPFTEEFMKLVAASTTSNVTFAMIPRDHWSVPDFIDDEQAEKAREQMAASGVIYGGSLSYRHMCRFNSGFFYKHPLLQDISWYWRVEPGVDFYCDIDYDPFMYMQENGKLYSFVIALKELESTIPTLWDHTLEYMLQRNVSSDLMSYFVSKDGDYNLCHFWSNFEIASLDWLRSEAYESYFQFLDKQKGFFMERWGDAPVHSLAAGMLLRRDQVHFFNDIGYKHESFMHCPDTASNMGMNLKCRCPRRKNFDNSKGSCLPQWKQYSPSVWSQRDTVEAMRLMKQKRLYVDASEPNIVTERRRWYDFFVGY